MCVSRSSNQTCDSVRSSPSTPRQQKHNGEHDFATRNNCITRTPRRSPRFQNAAAPKINSPREQSVGSSFINASVSRVLSMSKIPPESFDINQSAIKNFQAQERQEGGGLIVEGSSEEFSVMTKVYTYLHSLNKQKLRSVCKRLRCRLAGNKLELVFRSFLSLARIEERHGNVISFISTEKEFDGAENFFEDSSLAALNVQRVPSKSFMLEHLKAAGDKWKEENLPSTNVEAEKCDDPKDPSFSHSEFARLVTIMRDDERAKEALFCLSQELERPVLDAGIRRDSYWEVIAGRFNDASVTIKLDFSGSLDDVNALATPPCERAASFLKDHFKKARSDFTKAFVKWQASGQNDPERFVNFLSYNRGQLYASSKRVYIIFLCCQLGTPQANTLLLDSVTKSIAHGGQEEGLTPPSQASCEKAGDAVTREHKRRRKSNASILEEIHDASKSIIEASSAVARRCQQTNKMAASSMSLSQENSALHLLSMISKCYSELQAAYDNLQSAKDRVQRTGGTRYSLASRRRLLMQPGRCVRKWPKILNCLGIQTLTGRYVPVLVKRLSTSTISLTKQLIKLQTVPRRAVRLPLEGMRPEKSVR